MRLEQLIQEVPYVRSTRGDLQTEICALTANSRESVDRGLFFCIPA